ncbi:hypothetical protein PV415_39095, partial [Streptomyces sp. ME03-5684b]|uniref:hypothetical protein n=1 Tax=Streptomyces sp. ME03-5684b TaxID=3028681 RepID=UPI0029B4F427
MISSCTRAARRLCRATVPATSGDPGAGDAGARVGVEGAGLGEFVLVGRRQGQAVAVGEYPSRVVV